MLWREKRQSPHVPFLRHGKKWGVAAIKRYMKNASLTSLHCLSSLLRGGQHHIAIVPDCQSGLFGMLARLEKVSVERNECCFLDIDNPNEILGLMMNN